MIRKRLIFSWVAVAAFWRNLFMLTNLSHRLLYIPGFAPLRALIGKWKAWYCFEKAKRKCPAYTAFLKEHGGDVKLPGRFGLVPDFSAVTPMDKPNYIKAYSMEMRCHGGVIPVRGAVIDESSGSTGKPNNWVRGPAERKAVARIMQFALRELLGTKPLFFINAFALGPWATGMCVSGSIVDEVLLKSTGPDIDKILTTLRDFGPRFRYVIAGYPPFLKQLVDSTTVNWSEYELFAFYGGEGMSEGMRSYLGRVFQKVYGDYGASDLEINIAAEDDFTVAVRQLMTKNEDLRREINAPVSELCDDNHRLRDKLPHVFQYNAMDYMLETNEVGELLITLCRAGNVSPKIRYNIHDNGHVMTMRQLKRLLKKHGVKLKTLPKAMSDLPVMFLYGRSDLSVGFYGCKITPEEVSGILFETPEVAPIFNSFSMNPEKDEDENHNKQLLLAIELAPGKQAPAEVEPLRQHIFDALAVTTQDFRESRRIAAEKGVEPKLVFYGFREGPFKGSDIRTKANYTGAR